MLDPYNGGSEVDKRACLKLLTAAGLKPTLRAQALWPQVRSALSTLQRSLSPDAFEPKRDAVHFRLAMADATATLLMPATVRAVEASAALADLRVMPLLTRDPRLLLERGDADFAVGHFPDLLAALVTQGDEATLHHARLYDTRYVCVMRRGHPLARRRLTLASKNASVTGSGRLSVFRASCMKWSARITWR